VVGSKKSTLSKVVLIGGVLLFFYLPILILMVFSFNDSRSLTSWAGFSLRWYEDLFSSRDVASAVTTTIFIAVVSTIVSTFVGILMAIGLSKSKKVVKDIVNSINNLPILNPEIVTAIGLMLLFSALNLPRGYITLLLAHISFSIPYVILTILPKLRSLDPNLAEAAMDLGATPWQALTKVIVPQITPGILAGALIAFTMSFDDFVISYFVTGGGVKNISILVYTMSRRINPSINALSTLMVLVITVVLVIINVIPMLSKKERMPIE
jgi:spermidine/putrescine transport system permease protein